MSMQGPQGTSMRALAAAPQPGLHYPPKRAALAHIPGDEGWPIIGRTLSVLADPKGEVERMAAAYGPVYRSRILGETSVSLLGPEANELVLFDQAKLFSSTYGWETILGRLFPRGLMLLDFDEHRLHRRALSVAFKSGPMKSYLTQLDTGIGARVARWRQQPPGVTPFYPAMKQLTLDLAATSFLGTDIGPEVEDVTTAFIDMIAAAVSPVRQPWRQATSARVGTDSGRPRPRSTSSTNAVSSGATLSTWNPSAGSASSPTPEAASSCASLLGSLSLSWMSRAVTR